ncbi:MAG TPA: sulfotransferase [Gammaproteobacteria bacterium]|nr:sulfotransferase [Gammaproteobacteria bacterium]
MTDPAKPDSRQAAARLQQLWQLLQDGRRSHAIALAAALLDVKVDDARYFAALGHALHSLQQFDAARLALQCAISLQPGAASLHLGLANLELALGNLGAAGAACERSLALQPGYPDALFFRSGLRRQTHDDNHIEELKAALGSPPTAPDAHARIQFALAKELEDLGRYDQSFPILLRGARLYRGTLQFDLSDEVRFLEAIGTTWNAAEVRRRDAAAPASERVPVFITGLPRTGTTLVERILGAHSAVHSAGELPDFVRCLNRAMERLPGLEGHSRAAMVPASTGLDFAALGRDYLELAQPLAGTTPWFIDKLPQNSIYLGLIHRALPEARLVLVRRHPMDACYSMFKQIFTDSFAYSYDLDELAGYFIAHERLMRHWIAVLGDDLHVVRYEDVVDRLEDEARRLLAFCGPPWEPACLEFHRNSAPSTTASAGQVRQAIYRSSVGKWRHFRAALQPLEARLRAAGCLDGWEP